MKKSGVLQKKCVLVLILLLVSIVFPFIVSASHADEVLMDPETKAYEASIQARNQIVSRFAKTQIGNVLQGAVYSSVKEAFLALRNLGKNNLSQSLETEWTQTEQQRLSFIAARSDSEFHSPVVSNPTIQGSGSLYGLMSFTSPEETMAVLDLGDHKPLLGYLGKLFDSLRDQMGNAALRNGLIGDLYTLTYAIPVVLTPRSGGWKKEYTPQKYWVEYRRHFIPLANTATYHASKWACAKLLGAVTLGSQVCGFASDQLKFAMGRYAAPKISDFVFNQSNGFKTAWNITASDLKINRPEDLRKHP